MSAEPIRSTVERLDQIIGVKEEVAEAGLRPAFAKRDYPALCMAIGAQLGLRNTVRLGATTANIRFKTSALSKTDPWGRGTHGIVAQVVIPPNLPIYGTSAFDAHIVEMLLGKEFGTASFYTAVALLAHELSHVLLHGLRHADQESEQATDLVPILLGFRAIVRRGRTVSISEQQGESIYTSTIKYGYLTDEEFEAAVGAVESLVSRRRGRVAALRVVTSDLQRRSKRLRDEHSRRMEMIRQLDTSPSSVRRRDAQHLVAMHAPGYGEGLLKLLPRLEQTIKAVKPLGESNHFTEAMIARVEQLLAECASASTALTPAEADVLTDVRILSRNRPMSVRMAECCRTFILYVRRRFLNRAV
jgi:hypothetical protein